MGVNWKRRIFLSLASILLLIFLIICTTGSPFISAPVAAAGSWAGWGSMDTIAILPTSDEYLDTASQDLKTYLDEMSGRAWTIVQGYIDPPAIYLNVDNTTDNLTSRGNEAVELLADDNGIHITGKTSLATRHGAYILLDKLGYRYYFASSVWEVIPTSLTDLGAFDEVHEPFYWWRKIDVGRSGPGPWRPGEERWKATNRVGGYVAYNIGHSFNEILRQSIYGSKEGLYAVHPDWFTPTGWDGSAWEWQLKCDEPGVIALAVDYARSELSDPEKGSAAISPNDGLGWTPPWNTNQEITDKVFYLSNAVAENISADFPEKYITTYAYSKYSNVPTDNFTANVLVQIATNFNFSGLTTEEQIAGFAARGATVGIRGYLDVFSWYGGSPGEHSIELDVIPNGAAGGVRVYNTEATNGWAARGLTFYTAAKLLWDPSLSKQAIWDDFFVKAFGPASVPMKHFYDTSWVHTYKHYSSMHDIFATFVEAESLAAGDEKILERIRQLELYWRYVWKWHVVGISNLSTPDLMSFYTFATKLDSLFLLHQNRVEASLEEALAARGLSADNITALVDRTIPTTNETAAWLAEGLAAYPAITEPLPNPLGVDLGPLGDTTLPRLEPVFGKEKTILVQTVGNEDITVLAKSRGRFKIEWYDPMGLMLDEYYHDSSSNLPLTEIVFHTEFPGWYSLHQTAYHDDASLDVQNRPAAILAHSGLDMFTFDSEETMNAPYYSSSLRTGVVNKQYFYVPANTPSFVFSTQIGGDFSGGDNCTCAAGNLTDPNGSVALNFSFTGTDPIIPEEWTLDNPVAGVWEIAIDTINIDKRGNGYFWLTGIPPLVWHDAEYLLTNLNSPPVADNQSVTTNRNTPVNITVSASDPEGDNFTYAIVTGPSHGLLSGTLPAVTYTPSFDFFGSDNFTFTASDNWSTSNTSTVAIMVNPINDPPVANSQNVITSEGTSVNITVTVSDVNGDPLTYAVVTGPSHGSLSGTLPVITYTPTPNFTGSDNFTFKISDGSVTSNTVTVFITVNPVNDPPVANDDYVATYEETNVLIHVLDNDTDINGDLLSISQVNHGSHGLAVDNENNSITYIPDKGYVGEEVITYEVSDSNGGIDTATVFISVKPNVLESYISIEMSKQSFWKWWRVTVTVTASETNANRVPLADAVVNGHWSGIYEDTVSGITNNNGKLVFKTEWIRLSGMMHFSVDDVIKNGLAYSLTGEIEKTIFGDTKKRK
ncbi:DUF4838 domain-containing protein [Chloroflexota bacterium]